VSVNAYIRVKEGPNSPPDLYGIEKFTYVPEENCYLCPAGKPLNYVGINKRNRAHRYYSTVKRCRGCGQKPQCTRGKFRTIAIDTCEAARQKADGLLQGAGHALTRQTGVDLQRQTLAGERIHDGQDATSRR
jgi:hypothetical protein